MLSCSEVARICASDEIRSCGPVRRLAVRLHLLMCRHCRRYVRELAEIGEAVRSSTTAADGQAGQAILRNVFGEPDGPRL